MDLKINMEQFKDNIQGLLVNPKKSSLYDDIDQRTKAMFTQEYNRINMDTLKSAKKVKSTAGP